MLELRLAAELGISSVSEPLSELCPFCLEALATLLEVKKVSSGQVGNSQG